MKRSQCALLTCAAVLLCIALIAGCGDDEPAPDLSVHFADPNLEAAIRCALQRPTDPMYPWDLAGIGSLPANDLDCPDIKGVKTLSGIEHCSHLTILTLTGNYIVDITPLQDLTRLVNLYLGDNKISDISALRGLKRLQQLDLQENLIKDVGPLELLTDLRGLNLRQNRIGDETSEGQEESVLAPLAGLLSLSFLDLSDNNIRDIMPLVRNCEKGGLGIGDTVVLTNNPLSEFARTKEVEYLREKGVTVTLSSTP